MSPDRRGVMTDQGMERLIRAMLRVGAWYVNPASSQISRDGETAHLEVRTMRLLLYLAEHAGEIVSIDDLLDQVWSGVTVTPDSVYQAVASLRRLLGDDAKHPTYIATVPRLGYRLVATVSPWPDPSIPGGSDQDQSLAQEGAETNTKAETGSSPTSESEPPAAAATDAPAGGFRLRSGFAWSTAGAVLLAGLALVFDGRVANNKPSVSHPSAPRS